MIHLAAVLACIVLAPIALVLVYEIVGGIWQESPFGACVFMVILGIIGLNII